MHGQLMLCARRWEWLSAGGAESVIGADLADVQTRASAGAIVLEAARAGMLPSELFEHVKAAASVDPGSSTPATRVEVTTRLCSLWDEASRAIAGMIPGLGVHVPGRPMLGASDDRELYRLGREALQSIDASCARALARHLEKLERSDGQRQRPDLLLYLAIKQIAGVLGCSPRRDRIERRLRCPLIKRATRCFSVDLNLVDPTDRELLEKASAAEAEASRTRTRHRLPASGPAVPKL
jgi:hypothetical protein